ncbi:hypothetical protein IQN01_13685 [Pseudomonas sp. MAFF 301451]|nr:hypothetical protein [Pseudomonas cyclaminis]MBE8600764.1 hypothetical protein [Pseudomonas cyclaminis]
MSLELDVIWVNTACKAALAAVLSARLTETCASTRVSKSTSNTFTTPASLLPALAINVSNTLAS